MVKIMYDYAVTKEGKRRFNNPFFYSVTNKVQKFLHFIGIAWHNRYSDECTKDFNCCVDIGRNSFIKLPNKKVKNG